MQGTSIVCASAHVCVCAYMCVCVCVAYMCLLCSVTCVSAGTHIIVAGMPTEMASPTGISALLKAATSSTCNSTTEGGWY